MRMWKGKKSKKVMGALLVITLIAGILITPLQYAFAYGADGAQDVKRGGYYDLPETVEKYVSSGKTLEFDLNFEIQNTDNCQLKLYNDATQVSAQFFLRDGANGLIMETEELSDGWYHYIISLASIPHSDSQTDSSVNRIRVMTTFPDGAKINHIRIGVDLLLLPEAFTNDYDEITLADLGLAGTDYETPVFRGVYGYNGKSKTESVVVKLGWQVKNVSDIDWKLALDDQWNANCMVWFKNDNTYLCPGDKTYNELKLVAAPVGLGIHDVEFGRLRVTQGPNYGKDYVYVKIDGIELAGEYTDFYQTEGGYISHEGKKTVPSYNVCFVDDGVPELFSGFGDPDSFVDDIDYVNIGDIVPGGVVKDSVHDGYLGYTYHFDSLSETHSTVVKYVLKTGNFKEGALDGSVMVVDIGGNCGFCRSYISSGDKNHLLFGWEIDGCLNGRNSYKFESNTWYAFEQGRLRVASGANAGKDYVYIKIDGQLISYFYGEPTSRPLLGQDIYVEATEGFEVMGYDELHANYYVDDELYLDQLAQKGFPAKQPADPKKTGSYFVGWYTKKTGGELFDFKKTKLTESIDLYARFTTETVNVTFKPANGEASSNVISGKGCLVTEPQAPTHTDSEYVFAGWKNESTGKIFDFKVDRLSADTTFIAQYEEKKYYVSYYANGKLVEKVAFVKSKPTVTGKEPKVPEIANTTGVWETHATDGLNGNMTVNAVYTTTVPSSSNAIKLNKYSGGKIYINTDTVHSYLSTDISKQSDFMKEYTASNYEYQDHQNTSFKWDDSGSNSEYTVYFADNSSFNNAYIVKTKKTSLVNEVGIFVPGKTYYWFVCGNNTGKCSAVDSFTTVNTPVRYITAGSVINMRDLGGQVNSNGDKVRYELIYRGAALDEYTSHIDDKARGVFNYLGIKSEIELRGGNSHEFTGWDENNKNAYYVKGAMYQEILSADTEQIGQYKKVFEALADSSNYPFYFHCSAGADRTGTLAYLIYGLLGISYDDIRPEYELTSFTDRAIGKRTGDYYSTDKSLDETNRIMIENYSGGTGNLQTAIENYLKNYIGLESSTLESIKNILLDKNAVPNEQQCTITVDVLGKKTTYKAFEGIYYMPEAPKAMGKIFKGFYNGNKKYDGYTDGNISLTARFEDIEYEPYDVISLKDLGITEEKTLNQTNKLYSYDGIAKSGGRSLQFILEPIGDMKGGDGPQIALTNDWDKNSYARVWFQTNSLTQVYYNGVLGSGPDISKSISLESGKQYNVEYAVRVMKNSGYEGKKVFEVSIDGELIAQYIGCNAELDKKTIYFHGGAGSVYLINKQVYNEKLRTVTVDVLGKKMTYRTFSGEYFMPESPMVMGKFFKGYYNGNKKYDGYTDTNITLTARFEDFEFEPYDTISLKDLGIKEDKTINKTNTVFTYEKTAQSGGRLLQFVLEPIGDMNGGDGPQIALTNDWKKNSYARVWFQSNSQSHIYYNGVLGSGPDISKLISLEPGKQYNIEYAIRIMKNSGYEGKKVFEVSVNGEVIIQYIGCKAELDNNTIYFHGGTGSAYLINKPVLKTVNFYNGNTLWASYQVERSGLLPKIKEPSPQKGLPFAGWYTASSGGKLWDENADAVLNDMNLYAHFADVRVITANVDGKVYIYRIEVGKTLDELPKPKKSGNVFMGWLVNGKLFTGKVTSNLDITASFEPYSFDDYDEISLRDLGIYNDLDFAIFGDKHTKGYTYYQAAKTGGRVFKAIYIPSENMINGPQVSFSTKWDENYFAKLYFTKYDKLYVYSSGIDGGLPTLNMDTELVGGKEYLFEIGVRVLNNKGYKGVKVLTVYINGELIFEEFDNKANIEEDTVFFQGLPNTGIFRNIDIYKTVSFYDGDKLIASSKVLRGERVKSIGPLANKGERLFLGWYSEYGHLWDFDIDSIYLDTVLKAKYRKRTYPVLLMVDDVLYKRLNVFAGESVDIFDTPYKDGYEFDKWLSEDGSEYDLSTPVNAPVTLVASFKLSAKPSASDKEVNLGGQEKSGEFDLKLILFSLIGLAIIGAEAGLIIFKKRSKRQ